MGLGYTGVSHSRLDATKVGKVNQEPEKFPEGEKHSIIIEAKNSIGDRVINNLGGIKETSVEGKPKTMFQLLDHKFVEGVADVLTMGAKKYERDNWKKVDRDEYERAIYHHLSEYLQGHKLDKDSGQSHLHHIATNAMFLDWFDRETPIERRVGTCINIH